METWTPFFSLLGGASSDFSYHTAHCWIFDRNVSPTTCSVETVWFWGPVDCPLLSYRFFCVAVCQVLIVHNENYDCLTLLDVLHLKLCPDAMKDIQRTWILSEYMQSHKWLPCWYTERVYTELANLLWW